MRERAGPVPCARACPCIPFFAGFSAQGVWSLALKNVELFQNVGERERALFFGEGICISEVNIRKKWTKVRRIYRGVGLSASFEV